MTQSNPCIRCGKERIIAKSWKEQVGRSLLTYTTNICPDAACQKLIDKELKNRNDHLDAIHASSLLRKEENKRNRRKSQSTTQFP